MSERETEQEETPFPCHHTVMIYVFECYTMLPEIFVAAMGAKVFSGIKDSQLLLHAIEGVFVVMLPKE